MIFLVKKLIIWAAFAVIIPYAGDYVIGDDHWVLKPITRNVKNVVHKKIHQGCGYLEDLADEIASNDS